MKNNPPKSKLAIKKKNAILYLLLIPALLGLMIFIINRIPTFLMFDIQPPKFSESELQNDWFSETFSIYKNNGIENYLWSSKGVLKVSVDDNVNWQTIIDYFDNVLAQKGWIRSNEIFAPCWIYLPIADFLPENSVDGYVFYKRENSNDQFDDDFICLAVWPKVNEDTYYYIEIMTVRPQLLNKIISRIID